MAKPALRHRLQVRPEVEIEGTTADTVLDGILASVPAPRDLMPVPTRRPGAGGGASPPSSRLLLPADLPGGLWVVNGVLLRRRRRRLGCSPPPRPRSR